MPVWDFLNACDHRLAATQLVFGLQVSTFVRPLIRIDFRPLACRMLRVKTQNSQYHEYQLKELRVVVYMLLEYTLIGVQSVSYLLSNILLMTRPIFFN